MIVRKVRCRKKAAARTGKAFEFAPMTVSQARKLEVSDPISVVTAGGQRAVGTVTEVYHGAGFFTRIRVAHGMTHENFYNAGRKMSRLIVPQAPREVVFLPFHTGERKRVRVDAAKPRLDF